MSLNHRASALLVEHSPPSCIGSRNTTAASLLLGDVNINDIQTFVELELYGNVLACYTSHEAKATLTDSMDRFGSMRVPSSRTNRQYSELILESLQALCTTFSRGFFWGSVYRRSPREGCTKQTWTGRESSGSVAVTVSVFGDELPCPEQLDCTGAPNGDD